MKGAFADQCALELRDRSEHMEHEHAPRRGVSVLKGRAGVQAAEPTSLLRVILAGARGAVTQRNPTGTAMPAFSWKLTDEQIAAVATYIRNAWGNAVSAGSASDARAARNALKARTALSNAAD